MAAPRRESAIFVGAGGNDPARARVDAAWSGEVGLEVVGVSAPAGHRYPRGLQRKNAIREHLAQVRAWLDLQVLETKPKFAGPPVDLDGPGSATH